MARAAAQLGDDEFFRIARSWLAANDNQSVTRDDIYAHWEKETGLELSAFFDAWILGDPTPLRQFRVGVRFPGYPVTSRLSANA